jgi:periplasmic mercuric ion binding protein
MKTALKQIGLATLCLATYALAATAAQAEVKVTLSDMHICCNGCKTAIEKAAAKVPGVKCAASTDNYETALSADTKENLQKAVDEIVKAGFSGTPDNKEIKIAAVKAPEGKVTKLEIAHVHNCCGKCTTALKEALADVKGVKSNTIESKKTSFVVEGDFAAADVVKALVKAGFYPELKTAK